MEDTYIRSWQRSIFSGRTGWFQQGNAAKISDIRFWKIFYELIQDIKIESNFLIIFKKRNVSLMIKSNQKQSPQIQF